MVPKRRYLSYLRERWWVVLVCLALGIGAVVAYETLRPDKFESYAKLYFSQDAPLVQVAMFSEESPTYFGTQIELLKSSRLQQEAVDQLGPAAMESVKTPAGEPPFAMDVVRPMGTSVLQLRATGYDPALTQQFLAALIDRFLEYKKEARKTTSDDLTTSLTDQLLEQEKELKADQDHWAEFQKTNNVSAIEDESKSVGSYLAELNLETSKLNMERDLLQQEIESDNAALSNNIPTNQANLDAGLNTPPIIGSAAIAGGSGTNQLATADDTSLKSARVDLATLIGDRENKIRDMGEHAYQLQVERLRQLVYILEKENESQEEVQLKDLDRRIAAIQSIIPTLDQKMLDINERYSQTQLLKANIDREQQYRDHLLSTLQNVDLNKTVEQERLSVLEPASAGRPQKHYLPILILLATVGSLALAMGLVFVWHLLDDRFVSIRDIKDQYGEMVLGLVPRIRIPKSKPQTALLSPVDPRKAYVASYRHLRSALLLSNFGTNRSQTLLVTSAMAGEGKTTVCANLARVLAHSGLRVALMETAGHDGKLQQLLGGQGEPGILDFLRGEADIQAIQHATEIPGLTLVPIGTHRDAEYAEGLYLRPSFNELMENLRASHDFVILDSAPVLAGDDAALLVPQADVIVMVVSPFSTSGRLARQAMEMVYQRQAKQVVFLLNRARADDIAGFHASNGSVRRMPTV
jgi:Mrp family chromosome partitioning ATPase/uncharacterized protein involved in exopolysaccharide biosynthesis